MTLNELRYALALARHRHFGRAAEACFVSQPTLSVAIRKLEDELGVALFERGHDVRVTPIGERIIAQAQRVLEEADAIRELAQANQDQLGEPLRLGAIYTIGPYLIPPLLPVLHQRAPDMRLIIEENYTARLTERLRQGDLDVIVISLPYSEPGIVTLPLYDEPFVVLMPSGHPWRQRDTISADQLGDDTVLMLGAGHCFRDQVLEACPSCRRRPGDSALQQTVEGSSLETVRHMVASGFGVTVLPCTAAGADRYSERLLTIRRFHEPVPTRRVALAWRSSFPRPRAIEVLRQSILACELSCVHPVDAGR